MKPKTQIELSILLGGLTGIGAFIISGTLSFVMISFIMSTFLYNVVLGELK